MAIERLELEVSLRDGRGKSVTRKLRAAGQIPAVVYGSGISPTAICVESLALAKVLRGGANALVDLKGAKEDLGKIIGKEGRNARAIRTILGAASAKLRKRTVLEIIE